MGHRVTAASDWRVCAICDGTRHRHPRGQYPVCGAHVRERESERPWGQCLRGAVECVGAVLGLMLLLPMFLFIRR